MPEIKILERTVENLQARAKFVPESLNEEARTIDVVFVTENAVRTFDWNAYRTVDEILSCDPAHVRQERFKSGVPVLDNHQRWEGTKSQIGIVQNYRFENGRGIATLRFSKRKDVEENQWQDAKDGILRGISVGYQVHKYEITEEDGKRPVYRALDWEPLEISFAPVQADAGASVRNQQIQPDLISKNQDKMTDLQKRALAVGLPTTASETEVVAAERAASEAKTAEAERIRKEAVEAERKRSADITEAVRGAGLPTEFAAKLIADGTDINKSRELIINKLAETEKTEITGANRSATVGKEQSEKVRKGMEDSIFHRVNPGTELGAEAREFRNFSLFDNARFLLEQNGINTRQMSRVEIAQLALGLDNTRGYNSSSDFPIILGNTVNRTLRKAYSEQERTFKPFCRQAGAADFKTITRSQVSALVGNFDQIPEGGEYKHATLTEGKETYQLLKYGKKINFTWEALINDDLSAFDRVPAAIAARAANKQSDIVYGILSANAAMSDTVALFHADHGNLPTAAAITVASLGLARAAMRKQTGLAGEYINVMPKYLVVGPDKEAEAQSIINATIVATKTADTNIFRGSLEIIVDPRITGNKWYLMASPSQIDTIEYAFLDGEGELFTDKRVGFDVDGLEMKARMVFAAKAIDHRGMLYNSGA